MSGTESSERELLRGDEAAASRTTISARGPLPVVVIPPDPGFAVEWELPRKG